MGREEKKEENENDDDKKKSDEEKGGKEEECLPQHGGFFFIKFTASYSRYRSNLNNQTIRLNDSTDLEQICAFLRHMNALFNILQVSFYVL